jgi:two-component system sensor histidine kinase BarA
MSNQSYDKQIIDLTYGASLVGNDRELAKDLVKTFLESLPASLQEIQSAYQTQNCTQLEALIHKMHGGLCYCGIPQLKNITQKFDRALMEKNTSVIPSLYAVFKYEVNQVMATAKKCEELK